MYKKICIRCHQSSYSSAKEREWKCPSCLMDLTHQKARPAVHQTKLSFLYQQTKPLPVTSTLKDSTFSTYI